MEENLSAIWGVISAHNLQAMFSEHSDNKTNKLIPGAQEVQA